MRNPFVERKRAKAAQKFRSGYDWVAGALLRGTPAREIDIRLDNPFDSDEFEAGGKQAAIDFFNLIQRRTQP